MKNKGTAPFVGVGLAVGICLVFVLSFPATPQAPSADPDDFIEGNYWALIIGIDKYPALDKDKQLAVARKDAEAVAKVLKERYGFSDERMIELYDKEASRNGTIRAFSSLNQRLTDKDSLFIYFAGHGEFMEAARDKRESDDLAVAGYWMPSDVKVGDASTYIFNSQIRDYMANIPARYIFAVVDSAFSGALMGRSSPVEPSKGALKELHHKRSRWVLASGGLYPVPDVADKSKNGHSTFAWYFMKILSDNIKPYLLAKDIIEPLAIRVSNEVQGQLPRGAPVVAVGDEGGQFVFRLKKEFRK